MPKIDAQWWVVMAGLLGMTLQPIASDLMTWSDWSHTFDPKSVGRLLQVVSATLLAYQAGKLTTKPPQP